MITPLSRTPQPQVSSTTATTKPHADAKTTESSAAPNEAKKAAASSPQSQRAQLGTQIMQASLDVSISSGNEGMALLYRTAIEHINEHLAPELGPNALQGAMQQDNSAAATAGRILSQSTAFFEAYARQHPNEDPEDVVRNFVDIIRGGFEQGYSEAANILTSLGVMDEGSDIAAEIGKTFALVQKGYDDFLHTKLQALQDAQADEASTEATEHPTE